MSLLVKKPNQILYKHIHQFTSQVIEKRQRVKLFPAGSLRLPNSKIRLAFHFTDDIPWVEIGSNKIIQPRQNMRGYQLNPFTFNTNHSLEVLTVEFTPFGFYNIFGIPCSELTIAPICLESILHEDYQMLINELYTKNSFIQRSIILEQYFLKKIYPNWELDKAQDIYQLICKNNGLLNVQKIAENTFITERSLRRFFLKHFGLTPKSFIKFMRFEKSLVDVFKSEENQLMSTAIRHGYYDQAHFSNEFKNYMGMTLSELKNQIKSTTTSSI